MKRDMDLVRKVLLAMESDISVEQMKIDFNVADDTFFHHCWLLSDAGLIVGSEYAQTRAQARESSLPRSHPLYITWKGHEFLDASRDPGRWDRAKQIAANAGNWSFEVLASVLSQLAVQQVGRQLGLQP